VKFRAILSGILLVAAIAVGGVIAAPPLTTTAKSPTSRPAPPPLTPEERKQKQVLGLTRRSLELLKVKDYARAEDVLMEALALNPDQPTNIYNMACVKALTNRPDQALLYLERAVNAGFTDFLHIEHDEDLNSLRERPKYKELVAAKDQYQRKDAERAVASLRAQLGNKYLFDLDAEAKLIFAANTDAQTLAAVKKWLGMQARSQWAQLFEHRPDQYVAIVLPSAEDYRKIIKRPGVEGIYVHGSRMLIAKRLGQVMTHEFTHALHAGDLDPIGQEHPIWIVEGLASMFEAGQFEGETLVPKDNYRLWYLRAAARMNKLIPLEKLITWDQKQFIGNPNMAYGQASSVMLYLYEQGLLRQFYDGYKADFAKDPSGKWTLERITGKTIREFDRDWQAWMVRRTPPPTNTGPDGAFLGVQFAQGNDGLKIEQVVPQGPAAAAGVKVGDVIVGMNELDVRDQQSLVPLLKEFKPGDSVVFKLRRGEAYLDLPLKLGKRGANVVGAGKK
jgi:hypothetical protein